MRTPGEIIVFNALNGGIFSAGQRFFTRLPYTHVAMVTTPVFGVDSYIGADMTVNMQPFDNIFKDDGYLYQVYKPIAWTNSQIESAMKDIYKRFAAESYGYLQIAWFMYRGIAERWPFHADVRKQHNWFPNHPICSELGWWYLYNLAAMNGKTIDLKNKLDEWRPDTFNAGDTARVIQQFPNYFTLTEERWRGPR